MYEASLGLEETNFTTKPFRSSSQPLLPQQIETDSSNQYQVYPYHSLGRGKIFSGFESLAEWMALQKTVVIDGYGGVLWKSVREQLQKAFDKKQLSVRWVEMDDYLKTESEIQTLVAPFLGAPGTVWGKKCTYTLQDFFQLEVLQEIKADVAYDVNIVYGTGAALVNWQAPLVYLDLPKNEVQYRMRAESITNLACTKTFNASEMYKRFYFVDWVLLNEHKKNILPKISVIGDAQWGESLNWMPADALKQGLTYLSTHAFRVRPWFEKGAWGGQWMKEHLEGLNKDEVNYAWSFEMIVPENGFVFESDGHLLELSFDFLMFFDNRSVLGKHAPVFGNEFPIRFDFLDTWDGDNLSIQCHPSLSYIREVFGEKITQDETYYILDCKENATVYLGFQEGINEEEFRNVLEDSQEKNQAIKIEEYVQVHSAQKHDLFLIPNGTVHSAGANNLVLEISATPYIFTFKMYDWLRLDLNGQPRPINIDHAFRNLRFDRKGAVVKEQFISKPSVIEKGKDWQLVHLPTHKDHFYDVHRLEFETEVTIETKDVCHVLMLVEGSSMLVKNDDGVATKYNYAETFVLPAAAKKYTVINLGDGTAKLVKAFVKDECTSV